MLEIFNILFYFSKRKQIVRDVIWNVSFHLGVPLGMKYGRGKVCAALSNGYNPLKACLWSCM